jgi:hypothetical protein
MASAGRGFPDRLPALVALFSVGRGRVTRPLSGRRDVAARWESPERYQSLTACSPTASQGLQSWRLTRGFGGVGGGLQSPVHRFDSGRRFQHLGGCFPRSMALRS